MASPTPTYPQRISTRAAFCHLASQRIRHSLPERLRLTSYSRRTLPLLASPSALPASSQTVSGAVRSSHFTALGTATVARAIALPSRHLTTTTDRRAGMRSSLRDSSPTQAALMRGVGRWV